jgi:hypothetical protein
LVGRERVRQFSIVRLAATRPARVSRSIVAPALHTTTIRRDKLLLKRA